MTNKSQLKLPFVEKVGPEYAYKMGYDCGMNGSTEKNCHFSIFSSQENTKAWERGKVEAEAKRTK